MMWLLSSILTDSNIVSSREILEIFIRKFEVSKKFMNIMIIHLKSSIIIFQLLNYISCFL